MQAGQHPVIRILEVLIRNIQRLTKACGVIAAVLLVTACLVVCQMVMSRYFFSAATVWQTEFVMFCVVGASLIGSPYVLLHHGHVNVDILPQRLPLTLRYWFAFLVSAMACIVCVILAWAGGKYFLDAWQHGWRTESVWAPPLWIPLLALPTGLGMLSLQYVAECLQLLIKAVCPCESPAPDEAS